MCVRTRKDSLRSKRIEIVFDIISSVFKDYLKLNVEFDIWSKIILNSTLCYVNLAGRNQGLK